jgi:hypothetical protein
MESSELLENTVKPPKSNKWLYIGIVIGILVLGVIILGLIIYLKNTTTELETSTTTVEPTTTTIASTTIVAPTTIAPTIAPTTVAPTTIAPTTIAPTTIAPTTIAPTTIAPTTIAPTTIAPTTISPTIARIVKFYSNANYSGAVSELGPGMYNINNMGIGNDTISSIKIPQGLRVTLYENPDFQGKTIVLTSDNPNLSYYAYNDITSSIKIETI